MSRYKNHHREESVRSRLAKAMIDQLEQRTMLSTSLSPVQTSLAGQNFDSEDSVSSFYDVPAAPTAAVSGSWVVSVVNTVIQWNKKDGTSVTSKRLGKNATTYSGSFFASLDPVNDLEQPKVIYDEGSQRFIVAALETQNTADGDPSDTSRLLLAASIGTNPNSGWYFLAYNAKITIGGASTFADAPGLAVTGNTIFVTTNQFSYSSGALVGNRTWMIKKSDFYGNISPVFANVADPVSAVDAIPNTYRPTYIHGTGLPSSTGTFLVAFYPESGSDILGIIRIDNPLSTPSYDLQALSVGDIDNTSVAFPDAPQSGTTVKIDTGDTRTEDAVWRDNSLYLVNTVVPPSGTDAGQATAHWFQVNTSSVSSLSLTQQGNIGGESIATGTYTYYPSINVDNNDDISIAFSESSSSTYPGAYYTGRTPSDATGATEAPQKLAGGVSYYVRRFNGETNNLWGQYSSVALDPDGTSFWAFDEYAMARGTTLSGSGSDDGRWATELGSFLFQTTESPSTLFGQNTIAAGATSDSQPIKFDPYLDSVEAVSQAILNLN